jgi:hypothetical protein
MIFKAQMTVGKKTKSLWLVGKSWLGHLTGQQEFDAHHALMRELGTYDEFVCSEFHERNKDGSFDIVCAGNFY